MKSKQMDAFQKLLRPEFTSAFTCWFNSDDIDLNDTDDVMSRADTVAMTLLQAGLTPEEATAPLDEALRRWTPEVLKEFCDAGNIAWDFDDEEEEMLRTVLKRIIATTKRGMP